MTPEPGGGDRDDRKGGALGRLLRLLETLAEMEEDGERRRDGRTNVGGTSVDFSVNIGSVDDLADAFGGRGGRPDRGRGGDRDEAVDEPLDTHVDVRETETGVVVVADLPTVDEDDVDATVDDEAGELRITLGGETLGSVPLRGEELTVTDATVRNRILEVRLERSDHDR